MAMLNYAYGIIYGDHHAPIPTVSNALVSPRIKPIGISLRASNATLFPMGFKFALITRCIPIPITFIARAAEGQAIF
jgi:hypothetical protein